MEKEAREEFAWINQTLRQAKHDYEVVHGLHDSSADANRTDSITDVAANKKTGV